ncbi:MAG: SprT-like domain-containing protein [Gemmatirosa sp.]|nr:SprT-like domain-containing protein [Gemmatirosa sp.]
MTHRLRGEPEAQLALDLSERGAKREERGGLATPPRSSRFAPRSSPAEALHAQLHALGLKGIERVRLTRNRTVMVSFSGGELRVHEGYVDAPEAVLRAVVRFVCGRTRAERAQAREAILSHQIARPAVTRRRERGRPEDAPVVAQLVRFHAHYNRVYFGGRLRTLPIRLSGRMRTRLGHYTAASPTGEPAEIVIGRDHIRRHGWEEALHTLLHEMVHQWQDESGHAIDHGAAFRRKAREVGITASARRHVVPRRQRTAHPLPPAPEPHTIGLRAARGE